jgi:Secretion system C-terminal sorting domain
MKKYTTFVHNQNRFSLMKKIGIFILFALAILRGPQVVAQTCDSINFTVNYYSCGGPAPLTISYNNTGSITYTFKLDSLVSATNSWQNVRPGLHTISYTGSNGCASRSYIRYFYATPLQMNVVQQTRANCSDTTTQYRIDVSNGQAPYTYRIDGGAPTTNNVVTLRNGNHNIIATDAVGCKSDTIYNSNWNLQYRNDSIPMRYTFVPNNVCDSIGTLSVNPDVSLLRPFTVSLNGRPYLSDSVFRNIQLLNGFNTVLFKTAAGCIYQNRFIYFQPNTQLSYSINYNSCGTPAPLSINYYNSNGITYTFRLDGVASATNTWQNVSPGRHTLGYTSSNGCSRPDFDIIVNGTSNIFFYATEEGTRTCVDTVRQFFLNIYNGAYPYTFTVNGVAGTSTTPIVFFRRGLNDLIIKDATGCTLNTTYFANFGSDSAFVTQSFVPNSNCDSIGTLKISLKDLNLQRPLSISTDGGATFTADTVLRNINIYNYGNPIIVKTAQGCIYRSTRLIYARLPQKLDFYYSYQSYCNAPADVYIGLYNYANAYVLQLDGVAATNSIWNNIAPGRHTLRYTNGCNSLDTAFTLTTTNNLFVYTEQVPTTSCSDTIYKYKLKVIGGRAPFTFRINNGATTTDSIVALRQGWHIVDVTDASGCFVNGLSIYINYRRDSVTTVSTFTPNAACDAAGTLKILVTDPRLTRPFTISLNGGAFTSDSIFRNLTDYRGNMNFVVRSAQGCLYYGYTPYYSSPLPQLYVRDSTCANRLGFGDIAAYGYSSTGAALNVRWSNGSTSNILTNVRIGTYTVTVTDNVTGCSVSQSKTLTTCVWSGDTDTSGVVNANDLLNIGLAFGERGQSRVYCDSGSIYCMNWQPNYVPFWSKQTATGVNYKHIDADGNGVINHKDTLAITYNWQKTRNVRGNGNPLEVRGAAPPIFVQTGRVVEGQWASFPIMLGDATNVANGIYGLAFSINYDASVIDASTVYLTYNQNWLGSGDNVVRISKNFNGSIEAAVSRTNQQNASGNGQIATLNFKMKAGTMGRNLAFSIDNQQVINKDAQSIPIVPTPTSTSILSSTAEPDWARQIEVFPNPTTGNVNIEGQNLEIKSVEVFDISGKLIFKSENIGKGGLLSIEHAGTYFLKIQTEKGVLMRKVVRL